jgi:hypothetical protein
MEKKFSKIDFGKIFGDVSPPSCSRFVEFEFKDFGDFVQFGVKPKVKKE